MKKIIITEEEKKQILLKHGSKLPINEGLKDDIIAIQNKIEGLTADGVAGPRTINAILSKLTGKPADTTTQTTTTAPVVTNQTTTAPVVTNQTTTAPVAAATTFSATPVAGAATLELACGTRKTNNDFRKCKKAFRKASGL